VVSERHVNNTTTTDLVNTTGDRMAGRLATVKDGGVIMAGPDQEVPVEVIVVVVVVVVVVVLVVLEAGFGTICPFLSN